MHPGQPFRRSFERFEALRAATGVTSVVATVVEALRHDDVRHPSEDGATMSDQAATTATARWPAAPTGSPTCSAGSPWPRSSPCCTSTSRPSRGSASAPFRTGTEALHGLAWLGPATVFPQAVGLASTWNPDLVRAGRRGRRRRGARPAPQGPRAAAGLNVWAPVVNPLRDPRWGRNEEGYAEDPWLTGVHRHGVRRAACAATTRATCKTAPTLKHFLGYNNETDRGTHLQQPAARGCCTSTSCRRSGRRSRPAPRSP